MARYLNSFLAIALCFAVMISFTAAADSTTASQTTDDSNLPQTFTPTTLFPPAQMTSLTVDIHWVGGYSVADSAHIAYHYCSQGPRVTQCLLYDGLGKGAKLFGVELVVSADLFSTFSAQEKNLWSSHVFSIKAGVLVHPMLSEKDDLKSLQNGVTTYGKVINFFHPDSDMPYDNSQAGYGIVNQAQLDLITSLAETMDKEANLRTTYLQRASTRRAAMTFPSVVAGADPFQSSGKLPQYYTTTYKVDKTVGNPK